MSVATPAVVVVAYGDPEMLRGCLDPLGGLRVLVVDNGLSEVAKGIAEARGAEYLRPDSNLGFAGAVNVALRHINRSSDVLLLNPDARLDVQGVLKLEAALHEQRDIAAVAPRLVRPSGESEPTSWPMPTPWLPWQGLVGSSSPRPGRASFLSGAVLLLRAEALDSVGQFDERYFLYAEEADWQRRALSQGWKLREVPDVAATHVGAATSDDSKLRLRLFHGSGFLFIRKWHGPCGVALFWLGSALAATRRIVTAPTQTQRQVAIQTLRIYLTGPRRALPQHARRG